MRLKDVVELIKVDMPDHTEGAFNVRIESDDGGSHVTIRVEDHSDGYNILDIVAAQVIVDMRLVEARPLALGKIRLMRQGRY